MNSLFDKLDSVLGRYQEIDERLALPEVAADFAQVQELAKERASLEELVEISRGHRSLTGERDDLERLVHEEADSELARMARDELEEVNGRLDQLQMELKLALLPKDPNDERSVIVEVRAGTGGAEAGPFRQ